jgi:hypothetical protein
MRNIFFKVLIIIVILLSVGLNRVNAQKAFVDPEDLTEWVSYLASDKMLGRRNGSPEMREAAGWIAGKYEEMGLKPVNNKTGYIQNYTYTSRQNEVAERNVIGIIEGSDQLLKDQYIVLSAHFDHIGIRRGSTQDSINNGADDNAAGTATLLGIAKAIKLSGKKPGRSIIFAAFSGEENGMRGSRYFVANSPIPLNKIFADLNFEMTGHSEYLGKNKYYMTGCLMSDLDDIIGEYNKQTDFQLVDTIKLSHILFGSSDNIAFSRISVSEGVTTGIPSGTFATTTMAAHIHNVTDEVSLFDFDNMAGLVNHFSELVLWLSERKEEINWTNQNFVKPK